MVPDHSVRKGDELAMITVAASYSWFPALASDPLVPAFRLISGLAAFKSPGINILAPSEKVLKEADFLLFV